MKGSDFLEETFDHDQETASYGSKIRGVKQVYREADEYAEIDGTSAALLEPKSGGAREEDQVCSPHDGLILETDNLLGKREITEAFFLSETSEINNNGSKTPIISNVEFEGLSSHEEKESRAEIQIHEVHQSQPPARKKQGLNYILKPQEVEISALISASAAEACSHLFEVLPKADNRKKEELILVHQSLSGITLSYSDSYRRPLLQGLDSLSPRGFSILKKLAIKHNKQLKAKLHEVLSTNKNGQSAKIQLLTQEHARKLCLTQLADGMLISFVRDSVSAFARDFTAACVSLNSCTEPLKLSQILLYLLEAAQKNAPAVKAFLNHFHILICRIKNKLATEHMECSEQMTQLNLAEEVIRQACGIYEGCFGEDPLAFNDQFWNQRDSFTGGGLVLLIPEEKPFAASSNHRVPATRLRLDLPWPPAGDLSLPGEHSGAPPESCLLLDEEL